MNCADEDAKRFIRIFTFLPQEEILELEAEHTKAPQSRIIQKALAKDLTIRVHSETDYLNSIEASQILFGQNTSDKLKNLDEKMLLEIMEGVPQFSVERSDLENGIGIVELISEKAAIFPSKGEARKMITGGGVSINKVKIGDPSAKSSISDLLNDKYLLIQKGKKNYYLLIAG